MLLRFVTVLISALFASTLNAQSTAKVDVFDATLRAKSCFMDLYTKQTCRFNFGPELDFQIGGIGTNQPATHFYKVDYAAQGLFMVYASSHGCLVVQHASSPLNPAFINPRTAEIFRSWKECAK